MLLDTPEALDYRSITLAAMLRIFRAKEVAPSEFFIEGILLRDF
jgi:hypothetical protein